MFVLLLPPEEGAGVGFFKNILKKNDPGDASPEGFQRLKWGMASPIMLGLSGGVVSVRAFGTFSCRISDPEKFSEEDCDPEDVNSVAQYSRYLTDVVVNSFRDVLGAESSSMSMEELLGSVDLFSSATSKQASATLIAKGLEITELRVMKVVKA
jgi:membrane protease subunit (stomatin/prohibitin family)